MRKISIILFLLFNVSFLHADETKNAEFEIVNLEEVPVYQTKMDSNKTALTGVAKVKSDLRDKNKKNSSNDKFGNWSMEAKSKESLAVLGSNMLKGLAFCVGVALLGFAFLKRMKFVKNKQITKCNVIETLKLTEKSKLILVEIEGEKIALAVGQERVEKVHQVNKEESKIKVKNSTEKHVINEQGLELLCQ